MTVWIDAFGVACALGPDKASVAQAMQRGQSPGMQARSGWLAGRSPVIGAVETPLLELPADTEPAFQCRSNQLLWHVAAQVHAEIEAVSARVGPHRVAVVIGTTTSGMPENIDAIRHHKSAGRWPDDFLYARQTLSQCAEFLAERYALCGPTFTISTACTSSARAMLTGQRLLQAGLCDAVLCGGVDALCSLTLNGFDALQAISDTQCLPFSLNRRGINIGEGAALFLLTAQRPVGREPLALLGAGASSDAWHMSAPQPDGLGAISAMQQALRDAGLQAADIGWINLHGTATQANDVMESRAVDAVFGSTVPCTSTKPMTGHTLGAAGAVEAALCCLSLSRERTSDTLPPHLWDNCPDPALMPLALTQPGQPWRTGRRIAMSNSYAFGGSNAALILGEA